MVSSTLDNGSTRNSVVVLRIRRNFCRTVPLDAKNNHTKYEPQSQQWRPRTGIASGQPRFQTLHIFPPNHRTACSKHPKEGKWWPHSTCGLTSPCQIALYGPLTPQYVGQTPPSAPKQPYLLWTLAADNLQPRRGPLLGYCTCGSLVAKWKCEVGAHLGLSCALRCLCACLLCVLHAR